MIADLTPLSDGSRDVAMATNFRVKIGKSDYSPLLVALAVRNGWQYRHLDF